ncbi:MAG TPA: TonB family protein [Polyangia bacterium]|nr:TonB family protein [Polyangia bacterium]
MPSKTSFVLLSLLLACAHGSGGPPVRIDDAPAWWHGPPKTGDAVEYPEAAWNAGLEGDVALEVCIDELGRPTRVAAVSGPAELGQPAASTVQSWRFSPMYFKERAHGRVPSPACFPVHFAFRRTPAPADLTSDHATALVTRDYIRPQKLKGEFPHYSWGAKQQGVRGSVYARICVDADGTAHPAILLGLRKDLDNSVLTAVAGWQFAPATLRGQTVAACDLAIFSFTIR